MEQASRLLSFEGLTGAGRDGKATARLAESWSVSPDGLSWTFRLRSNAKFHDGSPVDAASVKRSLDDSLASLTDRSLAPGLQDIVAIDVAGPLELVVTLRDRSTFFLDDLSMAISKPRKGASPIGTGRFVMTSMSAGQAVMAAFPEHYLGPSQIHRVVWKPYPALRTAWAGMMRGEIDFLYEVSQDAVEFVQGEQSVNTYSALRPYVFGVVFNSSRQQFKDSTVRHALNFAINRETIVERALRGRGIVAHSPVWPAHWAYDSGVPGYLYDPARAAAMIDRAQGRATTHGGTGTAGNPVRLRFTCLLIENLAHWERMALLVQKQLFDIGVDMTLEAVPARVFNERVARGDFEAVFLELIGGFSMSRAYFFWHSTSPLNSFGYRDQSVDQALDAIRRAPDDAMYRSAVSGLQRRMINNPPAIFLAWGQTARAVSRRFQVNAPPGSDILSSVGSWQLAARAGTIPR